ncbi:MAG: hypothetical protein GF317_24850 [Candidatus Lokiarchaeota archaeon]|nr:hypothetical protein [Candidatus Lokiarchaeota archaeon]
MSEKERSLKVGVISDGKYGERAYANFKKLFSTLWIEVPEIPETVMLDEEVDLNIPDCDLYISYVRHPDIILELAEMQKPLILGITPGSGLLHQAKTINPDVIGPRTMCSLEATTNIPEIDEFAKHFGKLHYILEISGDMMIKRQEVKRSSPCGSSEASARFLEGKRLTISNLRDCALSVCHECRAPRFGHTCDKEVAGIIHILSLMDNKDMKEIYSKNKELCSFVENIKEEYKDRTSMH